MLCYFIKINAARCYFATTYTNNLVGPNCQNMIYYDLVNNLIPNIDRQTTLIISTPT